MISTVFYHLYFECNIFIKSLKLLTQSSGVLLYFNITLVFHSISISIESCFVQLIIYLIFYFFNNCFLIAEKLLELKGNKYLIQIISCYSRK